MASAMMHASPVSERQVPRPAARVVGVLVVALLLAACSTGVDRPPDCSAASVTRTAILTADRTLDPPAINVCHDQKVTIDVTVRADGVLHIHGYDDQGVAAAVHAGSSATLTFTATHPGQFVIELHANGASGGTGAGVLTVHEP
jgi:hypothetical protein